MSNIRNIASLVENEKGKKVIKIVFDYDLDMISNIRTLPGRLYYSDPPCWAVPVTIEAVEQLRKWNFTINKELSSFVESLIEKRHTFINAKIPGLKGILRPFQKAGVAFIEEKQGRALINDEMGLGKTIQSLAWLLLHPEKRPVIIVVPTSLKLNWKKEAEQWMTEPNIEILTGTKPWNLTGEIIIISYDVLFSWVDKLKAINAQVLILDEIHYIKDKLANETKAVKKLSKEIPHLICLTGISIVARPVEAYTAIKLINPELFPSFAEYTRTYGEITIPNYIGWESYGASTNKTSLTFGRNEEKRTEFMNWLREQVNKGLIEIGEYEQIGKGIEAEWTNKYITDTYKRKQSPGSIGGFFHIDRVGLLFTRTFSDLPGVTDAMDLVISRILAQGIADGDGYDVLARKIETAINETGLGDLGITDSTGQYISAKRRIKMLVQTEMTRAFHLASIQQERNWAELGIIVQMEWMTAGDRKVCDQCNALEGKIFSLDEIENMIPFHPECRCLALPYLKELEEYYSKPKEEEDWLGLREGIDTRKTAIPELYKILTDTIMIRRLKKDVLKDLPEKIYSFVPIELDNFKEYNEAEKDFMGFAEPENGSEVPAKSRSNQIPASIEGLVLLAVKGKLSQSIKWIKNFLEVGCRLAVYTNHKLVIEALLQAFPKISVKYNRSMTIIERQRALADFQTDQNIRLFIGDLQVSDIRITLPIASNIAFLELPLTSDGWVQFFNLNKWIGQKDIVNIYFLFASGTIEEKAANLIESKPYVFDAALDDIKTETASMISALMNDFENIRQ
jgi:SPP1 gp7 family putative phage head morphogenesis protein